MRRKKLKMAEVKESSTTVTKNYGSLEMDGPEGTKDSSNVQKQKLFAETEVEAFADAVDELEFEDDLIHNDFVMKSLVKIKEPPFIKLKDKFSFTFGVSNMVALAYFSGGFPFLLPIYYTIKACTLIPGRFVMYYQQVIAIFVATPSFTPPLLALAIFSLGFLLFCKHIIAYIPVGFPIEP